MKSVMIAAFVLAATASGANAAPPVLNGSEKDVGETIAKAHGFANSCQALAYASAQLEKSSSYIVRLSDHQYRIEKDQRGSDRSLAQSSDDQEAATAIDFYRHKACG